MTKRIFRSICLVGLVVVLASAVLIMGILYEYFTSIQKKQLRAESDLAAQGVMLQGEQYLQGLELEGCRITWIGADGVVLYDSQYAAGEMENHLERQEVRQALAAGYGESRRYSTTGMERLLYAAQRLPDGTVIRLSSAQESILNLVLGMLDPILIVVAIALGVALALAARVSRQIVRPLNELDLDEPLQSTEYDELAPLLRRIDSQQRQLKAQKMELRRRRGEFEAITGSMNEGLVLLNARGQVLSINPAAVRILETEPGCVGRDILSINRDPALQKLLEKAQEGQRGEKVIQIGENGYQLDVSPVLSEETVTGVAMLLFNVTERARAEQMRREFTANVSHELKTPLHTISGCAELLLNGLVRPEDEKQFASQIYGEAQRLIQLVEDIINLSHLDEGAEDMRREPVDLYALAESTVHSLAPAAERAGVTMRLQGRSARIGGMAQLLSGIVYNLCDNAIKYNRPGGTVTVSVAEREGAVALTVKDTGIGIPPEYQQRIFERFYRVDKSHSKEVGGTGLGLSIVKHAAMIHGARIQLESSPGEGTVITVIFPWEKEGDTA